MTYAELYEAVKRSIQSGMDFSIEVNTYCFRPEPVTTWEIWIQPWSKTFEGPTAQAAFDEFRKACEEVPAPEAESLEQTSAAVGTAEV
jgi:hypothetical protein